MNLRRITTHGNWIPEIDGMRFVAIAATLLTHIFAQSFLRSGKFDPTRLRHNPQFLIEHGDRGVLLFFAISGFILAQPFLRQHLQHGQPVSLRAFFMRRLTRLEPPYILSLIIYSIAIAAYTHHIRPLILPLLTHIVYLHNLSHLPSVNFVTWSLEVEVQFYILVPLLGYLYAIPSAILRRGIIVSLILASAAFQLNTHGIPSWSLPGQLQFFLAGFLLADLRASRTKSQVNPWWDLVSLIAWVSIFTIPQSGTPYLLPFLILVASLAVFNGPVTRQIFRIEWIALTGGMCYSFYLMHMLVIDVMFKLTRTFIVPSNFLLSYLIQVVLLGTCIYIFCTAYYVLIERPCMDPGWPRKLKTHLKRLTETGRTAVFDSGIDA
jgi:peptidoglycan/LPS O-acetylase OafA/YrhL